MSVAILIPVLDEEQALPEVLRAIPPGHRVVVCDNGSKDRSPEIAREMGAEVVFEPRRGYGAAVQAGLRCIADRPPEVVVIWDGDRSVEPEDLPVILAPIREGWADLVLGDRSDLADPASLTPPQRYGNLLAAWIIQQQTGRYFADMGPFRAIRYTTLLQLQMEDPTWGWNVEMLLKALKKGFRVVELPVHYRARLGVSKISGTWRGITRAGLKILVACWKYR